MASQLVFEEVGERNGLRLLTANQRDARRDWAVVGEAGAVQFTALGFPEELLEAATRLRIGWDVGLHWPRATHRGSQDYHDCYLLGAPCSFEVSGNLGYATHERVEHEIEAGGYDLDEAIWRVLEATYHSRIARP